MTNTSNPFAALLDGVPRWHTINDVKLPAPVMDERAVLAALAAAVPADLAEAGKVLEEIRRVDPFENPLAASEAEQRAADLITALLARIAAQEAQIKGLEAADRAQVEVIEKQADTIIRVNARAEAAKTALAAMTKERDDALHFLDVAVDKSPEPLKKLGKHLASLLDEDDWPTAERFLNGAATALAAERAKTAKLVEEIKRLTEVIDSTADYLEENHQSQGKPYRWLRAAITEAGQ